MSVSVKLFKQYSQGSFYILRHFKSFCILWKEIPHNKKGSSHEWLTRQLNDVYVRKSRYDRYRCRSAYKLLEIDEKFKILKPHSTVIDCGAAPGSWTQVVVRKLGLDTVVNNEENGYQNGLVIAVDLQYIDPIKGAVVIKESNFMDPEIQEKIFKLLPSGKVDVMLSDMAPKASGNSELDTASIMNLAYSALRFSIRTLRNNGTFLCKVWDSDDVQIMVKTLNSLFSSVKRVKPKACRSDSSELYLLARGFKAGPLKAK